jgi:hypothetical protein
MASKTRLPPGLSVPPYENVELETMTRGELTCRVNAGEYIVEVPTFVILNDTVETLPIETVLESAVTEIEV